jgi:UDP-N-acetyl-D-mannosaminuronate dehydrogenase
MNKSNLLVRIKDRNFCIGVIGLPLAVEITKAGFKTTGFGVQQKNVGYGLMQQHAKAVFDTKNMMKAIQNCDNIEVL